MKNLKEKIKNLFDPNNQDETKKILEELLEELKNTLPGKNIIDFLNASSDEFPFKEEFEDVTYGWEFFYDNEIVDEKGYLTVYFDIEYGHYIKNNYIKIDPTKKFVTNISLEEPFEGGGGEEEIEELVQKYLKK